ncbi:response regulator transcription factor [Parazoarcus communis]|uniref:response regulator transcription factor n=1 Tax=Parazoarcus communis TaxID=41977 RepID=UPI0018FF5916|nr:LuxR C-terminal-related transcriptional regulator [Parazoarcus communis]
MQSSIAHRLLDSGSTRATSAPRISERESEVLHLLGLGFSTLEIAQIQNRSINTIETQLASLKTKLRIKSGRDLIRHAIQIEETR